MKNDSLKDYTKLYDKEIKNGYSVNSGVFAVVDDSIRMELDEYGQYQPVLVDESQAKSKVDDKLAMVSAMSDESPNEDEIAKDLYAEVPGMQYDKTLGYYLDLYAGHVLEGDYRQHASSGGFGTWLLVKLLDKGLIDGVIHVKGTNGGDGVLFKYGISKTADEIKAGAKSRYYPAEFSSAINTIKKSKGRYAITGIPSFITEIRLLAKQDKEVADRIAFTFGLICGHQKSTKYAEALAWQHGIKPGDLKSIDFRKKASKDSADKYLTEMTGLVNGQETTMIKQQHEMFIGDWAHGFFKSKLSDFTDDAFNETADVSLGDAWLPEYIKDGNGNNILIVRHPEIAKIISEAIKDKTIRVDQVPASTIIKSQSGLVHHTQDEIGYRLHKKDVKNKWRPTKRFPASNELPFLRKRVQDSREFISTRSHLVYQEAIRRDDWAYFEKTMQPSVWQYKILYKLIRIKNKGPIGVMKKIFSKIARH